MDSGQNHKFINLGGQRFSINTPGAFTKSTFKVNGFSTDRYEFANGIILTITHNGNNASIDSNFRLTQLADGSFSFTNIPNPTFQGLHA